MSLKSLILFSAVAYGAAVQQNQAAAAIATCNSTDTCLSAVDAFGSSAAYFCSSFTSQTNPFVNGYFQSVCGGSASASARIASACACKTASGTSAVFSLPTGFSTSGISVPGFSTPSFSFPTATSIPGFSTSAFSVPGFSTPSFSTRTFSTPTFSVPGFSTPSITFTDLTTIPGLTSFPTARPTSTDACLAAFQPFPSAVLSQFCSGWATAPGTVAPFFQTACAGSASARISSVCTALVGARTTSSSAGGAGGATGASTCVPRTVTAPGVTVTVTTTVRV